MTAPPASPATSAVAANGATEPTHAPAPVISLASEQLASLLHRGEIAVATAIGFALVLASYIAPSVGWQTAAAWLVVRIAVSSARWLHVYACRGPVRRDLAACVGWMHALLLLDGAAWGAASLIVMEGGVGDAAFVACSVCCIACVGTFGLQQSHRATTMYVVPMLGISAFGLLARADTTGTAGAIGLTFILLMMLRAARTGEGRLVEVLRLRARDIEVAAIAERHSQAKSRYMAALSHEVRGPMHVILGLAHLVGEASTDAQVRHHCELMERSGNHILRLVNDLLDHAKIEAGSMRLDARPFDLQRETVELIEVYAQRAGGSGITCSLASTLDGPTWVLGDCGRLRQVVENLLGNALKFTPAGGTIRLQVSRTGAGYALAVHDSGPGISEADQRHLFEPFTQVGDRSMARQGAGLGLSISYDLCRLMGGRLECRSAPGAGSTFTAVLPLPATAPPGEPGDAAAIGAVGTLAATPPGPAPLTAPLRHRVLIVDDDPVAGLISVAAFERAGWHAVHLTSGEEAVAHTTTIEARPNAVFMDFDMPGIDGLEATRRIRRWEAEHGLPRLVVVGLSGRSTPKDRQQALAVGMDDMLVKPAALPELIARATAAAKCARPVEFACDGALADDAKQAVLPAAA